MALKQLYVDQPTQAGFSYGGNGTTSSVKAAVVVWKLLQNFYAQFPTYKNRDFGLFTESYGGHYGPAFTHYFEEQNAAIDAGKIKGEKIHLVALGINNGLFDQRKSPPSAPLNQCTPLTIVFLL